MKCDGHKKLVLKYFKALQYTAGLFLLAQTPSAFRKPFASQKVFYYKQASLLKVFHTWLLLLNTAQP
jgi:hypothetical protein